MNKDRIEGRWTQMKGKVKEKWGQLTDDELDKLEGRWEQLAGLIQQRYGVARDQAAKELDEIRRSFDEPEPAER